MKEHTLYDEYIKDDEFARLINQEDLIMDITENVCRILQEKRIKRTTLASIMGKTRGYISQLLSGRRNITLRSLADIAHYLGYSVNIVFEKKIKKGEQISLELEWDMNKRKTFPQDRVNLAADDYSFSGPGIARIGG